jgi:two-component system, OmpR family, sensor kinase
MTLLALGVQLLLASVVSRDVDSVLHDRADAVISAIQPAANGSDLELQRSALEPGDVVYAADGQVIAGTPAPALRDRVAALRAVSEPTTVAVGESHRLFATPFTVRLSAAGSASTGVIVVAERLRPYERIESYALIASMALGVVVIVAAGGMAAWITHRALAPVAAMAARAEEWSEHDLGRRFELGTPTNEITALGATLDHLLERVSMAIRSEQRLTAELAHELRTPLTSIQGATDLALLRGDLSSAVQEDLEQVATATRAMSNTISALLDLAREHAARGEGRGAERTLDAETTEVSAAMEMARSQVSGAITVDLGPSDLERGRSVRLAAPQELAARAMIPILDNAVRHSRSQVVMSCDVSDAHVDVLIDDDGPGVPLDRRERLFQSGLSGRNGGTGLGLGIARRMARSLGGDVIVGDQPAGGGRFIVRFPRL